jgi:hypothetical protein
VRELSELFRRVSFAASAGVALELLPQLTRCQLQIAQTVRTADRSCS